MNTLEFLQRVLPSRGVYCSLVLGANGSKRQGFYDSIQELSDAVIDKDQNRQNTYFAISALKERGNRKKANTRECKVLALDIDCGTSKPYTDWKQGLVALGEFITTTGMPAPLIVQSGYGLHVYWVLDRAVPTSEWEFLAGSLKAAVTEHKFEVDAGLVANPSLVLRPVRTHNWKDLQAPKPVKVLLDGGDTTVETIRSVLSRYKPVTSPKQNTPASPKGSLLSKLAVSYDAPPACSEPIVAKCAQVEWAVNNQASVREPEWYNLIGLAAFCEDPEDTAIAWSNQHPDYSEEATLGKLRQWQAQADGPTTCNKFESDNPGGCKGCPHAGNIGSPIRLGVRYTPVDTTATAPDEVSTEVEIPKPFKRTTRGIVVTIDDVETVVTDFDIYPVSYGYDESLGYEVAQFMWDRRHVGWKVLTIRQAYMADGTYKEFVGTIADQGVVLETRKQTEYFQIMLRAYMNKLKQVKTVTDLHSTMGWKDGFKAFVLGDSIYRREDSGRVTVEHIRLASRSTRASDEMFVTGGSQAAWYAGTEAITSAGLYAHQYSIGVGLSSVLFAFTGLKGVTISFYGPSGSGKSLAQYMQQSVWGDPEKLHFQSKFTQNTLFNRFGTYGNLPMTVDEATQMTDKDVGDYLYWVSQGRDKARLSRNAEEKAPREWALTSTLSTNKPIASKLIAHGNETDAQLARLLELHVPASPLLASNSDVGRKFYQLFTENYGWAGREFLRCLMVLGESGIRAAMAQAADEFKQEYGNRFSGVERYWEQAVVLPYTAIKLARKWGLVAFDEAKCIGWVLSQIEDMRQTVVDNQLDMFDMVSEYMNEHGKETLRIFYTPGQPAYFDAMSLPRGAIRVRINGFRKSNSTDLFGGVVLLDRTHFRQWFAQRGGNHREFIATLTKDGANATPKSQKASMGKDTPLSMPQSYVIGINLNHPRMKGVLGATEQALDDMILGDLAAV